MTKLGQADDAGPLGKWMKDDEARQALVFQRRALLNPERGVLQEPVADAFLDYVDHGPVHQEHVARLLDQLLHCISTKAPHFRLTDLELYLLGVATVVHDAGMYYGEALHDPGAGDEARKLHGTRSAKRITNDKLVPDLGPSLESLVARIAESHRGSDWQAGLHQEVECAWPAARGARYQVRPRLLAALLRLADAMHMGRTRLLYRGDRPAALESRVASTKRTIDSRLSDIERDHPHFSKIVADIRSELESERPVETPLLELERDHPDLGDLIALHNTHLSNLKVHHPRHRLIRDVAVRPDAFYVIPEDLAHTRDPGKRLMLRQATKDLRREVRDSAKTISDIMGQPVLPLTVRIAEPPPWPSEVSASQLPAEVTGEGRSSSEAIDAAGQGMPRGRDDVIAAEETVAGMEELVSPERGADPSSTIALGVTESLAADLGIGEPRIVLHGTAGVGKSRIVAGLFHLGDTKLPRMLRFKGQSIDALKDLIVVAGRLGRPCIVFDENHQERRGREFFRGLLEPQQLAALCEKSQILLSVRTSTYQALRSEFDGFLVYQHAGVPPERLDDYRAWGLAKELTAEQKRLIVEIAGARYGDASADAHNRQEDYGAESRLLLPFLVGACLRMIRDKHDLSRSALSHESSILDQIWNILTSSSGCDDNDKRVLAALALAIEQGTLEQGALVPSTLVAAILRSCGIGMTAEEVAARLQTLYADRIVSSTELPTFRDCASWKFAHDLYYESALSHAKDEIGASAIHPSKMTAAAVELVGAAKPDSVEALGELGKLYAVLVARSRDAQLALARALIRVGEAQVANGALQASEYVSSLARIIPWTQRLTAPDIDPRFCRSLYEAGCLFADAVSQYVTARDVLGFDGRLTSVLLMGYMLALTAFAAKALEESAIVEIGESKIEPLRAIGRRCEAEAVKIQTDAGDRLPRTYLATLLVWAGSFQAAARLYWQHFISCVEKNEDLRWVLHYAEVAAAYYLESGDVSAAARCYRDAVLAAKGDGLRTSREIYTSHAALLETAARAGDGADWSLLMRYHESAIAKWRRSTAPPEGRVAMICNYPEIAVASLLAEAYARQGVDARPVYIEVVAKSPDQLGLFRDMPVIVLGSHNAGFVRSLIRTVGAREHVLLMDSTYVDPPKYGRVWLSPDDRPPLWVGGVSNRQTAEAVRALIDDGEYMDVVEQNAHR
jgi:hypothetical protein